MSRLIEIHWTCGSIDEARKISRYLVQEGLVSCANITPWVESVFQWNGDLETAQETLVLFKTTEELFSTVCEVIESNTKYELPVITYFPIEGGNVEGVQWLKEGVKATTMQSS
jgi:periplasmic divalent cation tolerance protein